MSLFSKEEYDQLHALVFVAGYSGYKPTVQEIPNGDGKVDADKMFAHVAPKYLVTDQQKADLMPFLQKAFNKAIAMAQLARVPEAFMPRIEYGALRILDYPPGAVSNKHCDFDLFTTMCYRDMPDKFVADPVTKPSLALNRLHLLDKQAHIGELGEIVGLGGATPHEVLASTPEEGNQHSIVYFSIPDWNSVLPAYEGKPEIKVVDWLNERMAQSRTAFDKYKPAS
jgi:hypothetical protein